MAFSAHVVWAFWICLGFFFTRNAEAYKDVVSKSGSNVCTWYYSQGYRSCGGGWCLEWDGCCTTTSYRKVSVHQCCTGWVTVDNTNCNQAKCDGKIRADKGCYVTIPNGYYIVGGNSVTSRHGSCVAPNKCSSCGDGTYADGGFCKVCTQITHCDQDVCAKKGASTCARCSGTFGVNTASSFGWNDFVNLKTSCVDGCSRRTPCWPGTCAEHKFSRCSCSPAFTGSGCISIRSDKPMPLLMFSVKLRDADSGYIATHNPDVNSKSSELKWTNAMRCNKAEIEFQTEFKTTIPGTTPKYLKGYKVGLISVKYQIKSNGAQYKAYTDCPSGIDKNKPTHFVDCVRTETIPYPRRSGDSMDILIRTVNGGFRKIGDPSSSSVTRTEYYKGHTTNHRTITFKFDDTLPYSSATVPFKLNYGEVYRTGSKMDFTWYSWKDGHSGLDKKNFAVWQMTDHGSKLRESKSYISEKTAATFYPDRKGIFALIFLPYDVAGNHRPTRRFFIYDPDSTITKVSGKVLRATSATSQTSYKWQTNLDQPIVINYAGLYTNLDYVNGGWLKPVDAYSSYGTCDVKYEDYEGRLTMNGFRNLRGIVKLEYGTSIHQMDKEPVLTSKLSSKHVDDLLVEGQTIPIGRKDGDTIHVELKLTDFSANVLWDHINIRIDSSKPIIENLWIIKHGYTAMFLHDAEELEKATFEWDTFDIHSGLYSVKYRLWGDSDNVDVTQNIPNQKTTTGHDYCTMMGCFAKHFSVNPPVTKGKHDLDYNFEVTVVNEAQLLSTKKIKITIDDTPAEPGVVHDGPAGGPDVDYQSSKTHRANWEGFHDRESGIRFYHYIFASSCKDASFFDLDTPDPAKKETTAHSASHTVTYEGKSYITVVAYNNALEPSVPVCSDGVTTDFSEPVIGNIKVANSLSKTATSVLTVDRYVSANWTATDSGSGIGKYEFGLSTTNTGGIPDILGFTSCGKGHHGHFRTYHSGLSEGKIFYIVIRATNRALLSKTKHFGPYVVEVTPPTFSGTITPALKNGNLYVEWKSGAFTDAEDSDPFKYTFAVGESAGSREVSLWSALSAGPDCTLTDPPTCTLVNSKHSTWKLQPGHTYYVSIKAVNFVGLHVVATSPALVHYADAPPKGVVLDGKKLDDTAIGALKAGGDIDYQTSKTTLSARWIGFERAHHTNTYKVGVGSVPGKTDIVAFITTSKDSYEFTSLSLSAFTTYFITLEAKNAFGKVTASSDGVQVLDAGATLSTVVVYDGLPICKEHVKCRHDLDYQASPRVLSAHWWIPKSLAPYVTHAQWRVEVQDDQVDGTSWRTFEDYVDVRHNLWSVTKTNLGLEAGKRYRSSMKFCRGSVCFKDVRSDAVLIQPNPPAAGNVVIEYTEPKTITVGFDKFLDIDIPGKYDTLARDSVEDEYEWTIRGESEQGGHLDEWEEVKGSTTNDTAVSFTLTLDNPLSFKSCPQLGLRGKTKSGLYTDVFTDVKDCKLNKPAIPRVIDACGKPETGAASNIGEPIKMNKNDYWLVPDRDYTPFTNLLSATWPTLRYHNYMYAVIADDGLNPYSHYTRPDKMNYTNPCSEPTAIACGTTTDEHINVKFGDGILQHGKRYYICIQANETNIVFEKWQEVLPFLAVCSDGITVDLTAPEKGSVWIGTKNDSSYYQTSTSELMVNWEDFVDVEEHGKSPHHSGIKYFEYAIGTHPFEGNVVDFTNAGVTSYALAHGLTLQNGHTYYATVKATDFIGRSSLASSPGITIDHTPPEKLGNKMNHGIHYHTSTSSIEANWEGIFSDKESGIDYFEWSVGSEKGFADVMTYTKAEDVTATSPVGTDLGLHEGHGYYTSVKAFNRAGLSTSIYSWLTIVDASPPVAGYVYDGRRKAATATKKDQDYQTNVNMIAAHWDGFNDPHSGIVSYTWSVGTCSGCADLLSNHYLGLAEDAEASHLNLGQGIAYYVTVTACNGAGMCTKVTSDGIILDASAPTPGIVLDGGDYHDVDYQYSKTSIEAKWWGFVDAQSGLSHYSWWAGTTPGGKDVLAEERLHKFEMVYKLHLPKGPLPVNEKIYITVKATNNAGMTAQATSNGFIVDTTSPVVNKKPGLADAHQFVRPNTWMFRTFLKVSWDIKDAETPIGEQFISLKTDYGAVEDAKELLFGPQYEYTFANLDLQDGNTYYVTIVTCNLAKACTTSVSDGILVDTSAPIHGSYSIDPNIGGRKTPWREGGSKKMTWSANNVFLMWAGFADLHSGIHSYQVTMGSKFHGRDVLDSTTVPHNKNGHKLGIEGPRQEKSFTTKKSVSSGNYLYVSIYAINEVGLESYVVQSKFILSSGSRLDLIRVCTAESCNGDCICAGDNIRCTDSVGACSKKTSGYPALTVYDILRPSRTPANAPDIDYTPSRSVLMARWSVASHAKKPIRYEWSAGYAKDVTPSGIFDHVTEVVWHDVGLKTDAILSRPDDFDLTKYVFFVRAWFSATDYVEARSDGVTPDDQAPMLGNRQGKQVKECHDTTGTRDVDYLTKTTDYCTRWTGRFIGNVDHYKYSISTYPGGANVVAFSKAAGGSGTDIATKSGLSLVTGRTYYANVWAITKTNLMTMASSDGVVVDTVAPVAGLVHDGTGLHDAIYQNFTDTVGAHWNGFVDLESYIEHYMWCVGKTTSTTECGVRAEENVGLRTVIRKSVTGLASGMTIYNKVYAVDAAGLKSPVAVSDGIVVDNTPPVAVTSLQFGENLVKNPSFETDTGITRANLKTNKKDTPVTNWKRSTKRKSLLVKDANVAKDGVNYLVLHGEVSQLITGLQLKARYRLSFSANVYDPSPNPKHVQNLHVVLPDGSKHSVEIGRRSERLDAKKSLEQDWRKTYFYFTAKKIPGDLKFIFKAESTALLIDNVIIEKVLSGESKSTKFMHKDFKTPLDVQGRFSTDGSSVNVAWNFKDDESTIVDYEYALGTTKGATQLQDYKSVGQRTHAVTYDLSLTHVKQLYITVIATNGAGLRTALLSDAINIDISAPVFEFVWDGDSTEDIDYQNSLEVMAKWKVADPESDIEYCEIGLGRSPGSLEVMNYVKLGNGVYSYSKKYAEGELDDGKLYCTVRCHNYAGHETTAITDGVIIDTKQPASDNAVAELLTASHSLYPRRGNYISKQDRVFIKWSGFEMPTDILTYEVQMKGENIWNNKWLTLKGDGMEYMNGTDMAMEDGLQYEARVRARNVVDQVSEYIKVDVKYTSKGPSVPKVKPVLTAAWVKTDELLEVDWADVYTSMSPVVYELSVGTKVGAADIALWKETKDTKLEIPFKYGLPKEATNLYLTLSVIDEAGLYRTDAFKMPLDALTEIVL